LAALPDGLAHVSPLLKFPAGRRATASVAARQVRRRHLILVIRATGAPLTPDIRLLVHVLSGVLQEDRRSRHAEQHHGEHRGRRLGTRLAGAQHAQVMG